MEKPLAGFTVAVPEHRQLDEFVSLLEAEGASTLRCPMVAILDNPDERPVLDWLEKLLAGQFDLVILMTGEAVRRLLGFAERAGWRDAYLAALGKTRKLTRGPKPLQALRELGLTSDMQAEAPTTAGVIARLEREDLTNLRIGVTLYGQPNPELHNYLLRRGAQVFEVMPYIYAPASDADRVAELIERLARGEVDAIAFTSSPQVDRLFEVAQQRGFEKLLRQGLERTYVAAVGPVVQQRLSELGVRVDIAPSRGFVMKNLVQHMARALAAKKSVAQS
ncbi:MAG: uroporphyrinogen-III synthase [Gemmatales bacterium]|nr:uroporphyrinogen-III synthase [Gemmatales bacterium]MDW8222142.1 uroporphyrinogen-III synthase [Gemmatales bacterium]